MNAAPTGNEAEATRPRTRAARAGPAGRPHPPSTYRRRRLAVATGISAVIAIGAVGASRGQTNSAVPTTTTPASPSSSAPTALSTQAAVATIPPTTDPTTLDAPLQLGATGDAVVRLQDRLRQLGFEPGPSDGNFGTLTRQAVWAFEKLVLGTPLDEATGVVTTQLWQAIVDQPPIQPRRSFAAGETSQDHTEVYLPEQVVAFFVDDQAVLISHMSSGSGEQWRETVTIGPGEYRNETGTEPIRLGLMGRSVTPGGVYVYDRIVDGRRLGALGAMYDPAYFNHGIAIHGGDVVPLHPASHGCIRLPRYISDRFHRFIGRGDQVWVWDGDNQPEWLGQVAPPFDQTDPNWTG